MASINIRAGQPSQPGQRGRKMDKMKKKVLQFEAVEDCCIGLSLYVWKRKKLIYVRNGYKHCPGQLFEDISSLRRGDNPATDWKGNQLSETNIYPVIGWNFDLRIIADNAGIYPDRMMEAGQTEFEKWIWDVKKIPMKMIRK